MRKKSTFDGSQDEAIAEAYLEVSVPSDELTGDTEAAKYFVMSYRSRSNDVTHSTPEVVSRAITLRKNGKLPRLGDRWKGR